MGCVFCNGLSKLKLSLGIIKVINVEMEDLVKMKTSFVFKNKNNLFNVLNASTNNLERILKKPISR
jgi:hypothetical protein